MKAARNHGFLWRIRKDGRDSWLYGTVHVARFEWMFPGPGVITALKASDTIALELDVLDPGIQHRMAEGMAAPSDTVLPEPLAQRLRRLAEAECVPAAMLARLTPGDAGRHAVESWPAGATASTRPTASTSCSPAGRAVRSKDGGLARNARTATRDADDGDTGRDAGVRRQRVDRNGDRPCRAVADAHRAGLGRRRPGHALALRIVVRLHQDAADRAALARLLDERNPALADSIAALHAGGQRVFAAVGSLHMIGPLGLPALMAQRGFRVEQRGPRRSECKNAATV